MYHMLTHIILLCSFKDQVLNYVMYYALIWGVEFYYMISGGFFASVK